MELKFINKNDKIYIKKITSNINIMKYVGNGQIWDQKKLDNFMKYILIENDLKNKKNYYYYKIIDKNIFIGIIGISKLQNDSHHNITYFIDQKYWKKGYTTKAIGIILQKVNHINHIYALILENNIPSQKVVKKNGFIFNKIVNKNNKKYKQYIYYYKYHKVLKHEYPYLKYFLSKEDILGCLKKLRDYKANIINGSIDKFTHKMKMIIDHHKEYSINLITDYYTDYCRVRCIFKGKLLSPLQYYSKVKGYLIKKSITNNKFDIEKFENNIYNSKYTKLCNNFKPTIALTIYKIFNAKNILDSSAGWGDRLIAAIAGNYNYLGIDPSDCLKPLYNKIIDDIGDKKKHKIINKGFEEVEIEKNKYDLCFTSPPFFDLEIYEDNKKQSIYKYTSQESWEKEFLILLAKKNIDALITGGYFVIYVPNNYKYFNLYMKNNKEIKYCGYLSFITPRKRDIYVWKKL